ncbi:MAG TPA: TIM barrel protein [Actinomycetota bacterium]|nr:TIM barrel protein [Actinomycetota bacterium]
MRLGGWHSAERAEDLPALCERLDAHGLSAIPAPNRIAEMPDDECVAFGEAARGLGLVVGETGMWENLMTADPARRTERIERVRTLLRKAELMGCRSVISLVGSGHPSDHMLAPDAAMLTAEGERAFREVALRIVDGLELERTCYAIEPWRTSFFYRPEDIATFLDSVDHPRVRLHLDLVNMVGRRDYFDTAGLAERTFALLSERIVAAHIKDVRWIHEHMQIRWDEVPVGDGVMDLGAYLRGLATLDPDLPCFCEHLATEAEYAESFARLQRIAAEHDLRFVPRDLPERKERP